VSPVLDPEQLVPARTDVRHLLGAFFGVALAATVLVALWSALRPPGFVERLTLVNDSVYDVDVRVSGGRDAPILRLGTVPRERENRMRAVLDQGRDWVFRFTYGGQDGGTLVVDRDELERAGWTLSVPATVERQLQRHGLPPSPATRTSDSER
jgi:hypothetical protein